MQKMNLFRLMHELSDLFQIMLMLCFTWSLFAISAALLIIQVEVVEYPILFKINDLCVDFSELKFNYLISVAEWQCCACFADNSMWICGVVTSVHQLRAW